MSAEMPCQGHLNIIITYYDQIIGMNYNEWVHVLGVSVQIELKLDYQGVETIVKYS